MIQAAGAGDGGAKAPPFFFARAACSRELISKNFLLTKSLFQAILLAVRRCFKWLPLPDMRLTSGRAQIEARLCPFGQSRFFALAGSARGLRGALVRRGLNPLVSSNKNPLHIFPLYCIMLQNTRMDTRKSLYLAAIICLDIGGLAWRVWICLKVPMFFTLKSRAR